MKKIAFFILLLTLTLRVFGQRDQGVPFYVNVSVAPIVEYMPIDGKGNILGGAAGFFTFNKDMFVGVFYNQNLQQTESSLKDYAGYKIKYNEFGTWIGIGLNLGVKKNALGSYEKRRAKFQYSAQIGMSSISIKKTTSNVEPRDSYFFVKPCLGFDLPMGEMMSLSFGGFYQIPFGTGTNLGYENTSFMNFGAYATVKFSTFSRKMGTVYSVE